MQRFQQLYRILIISLIPLVVWNTVLVFQAIYSPFSRFTKEAWILYVVIWGIGLASNIILTLGAPNYGKKTIGILILGFMGVLATLLISLGLSNFG